MSKFKVKLKITGFELEVEGTKDEVTLITNTVSNQLGALTMPQGFLGDKPVTLDVNAETIDHVTKNGHSNVKARRKNGSAAKAPKGDTQAAAIELTNDPARYGTPTVDWSILQKGMWILYVAEETAGVKEMSAGSIAATYEKYFRQTKTFRPSNVSRDFGKKKTGSGPFVAENPNANPSTWYLLEPGKTAVKALIAEQKAASGS